MSLQQRQGDRLFVQQATLPSRPLTVRQGIRIVADEATGPAHRLQTGAIQDAPDGTRSLNIPHPTQVVHEEHGPLTLEPGLWRVVRKPEYRPEAIRTVVD